MRLMVILLSLGFVSVSLPAAAATDAAKPLLFNPAPVPAAKPDISPEGIPQVFVDERNSLRDSFNALMNENKTLQTECATATAPGPHALCERKKAAWQVRMDAEHAQMRNLGRKIDTWRRKQAGLPPPTWYDNPPVRTGSATGQNGGTAAKSQNSVLLPSSTSAVPASLY